MAPTNPCRFDFLVSNFFVNDGATNKALAPLSQGEGEQETLRKVEQKWSSFHMTQLLTPVLTENL